MRIAPLPGHTAESVHSVLHGIAIDAANVHSAGGSAIDRFNAYLEFASEAVQVLGVYLRAADVERLVCSQRYWTLQSLDPSVLSTRALAALVFAEEHAVAERLAEAVDVLDAAAARWRARAGSLVVLDTNVYCRTAKAFEETDWHAVLGIDEAIHIVMPLVIVDELDRLKRVTEVKGRARATLRAIDRLIHDPSQPVSIQPADADRAFTFELLVDEIGHVRHERADDEIVDRAANLSRVAGKPVILVTFDTGARVRGRLADLPVVQIDEPNPSSKE